MRAAQSPWGTPRLWSGLALLCATSAALADPPSVTTTPETAQTTTPLQLQMSDSIEAGGFHQNVSGNYGDWNGAFVRLTDRVSSTDLLYGELVSSHEFGASGTLASLTDTHDFSPGFFTQLSGSFSDGGFYLPRVRGDLTLNEKWLGQDQLVTSEGVSVIDYRDGHVDHALTLGAAYYFPGPFVLEGGLRANLSTPGDVYATTYYVAGTYGTQGVRYVSLRLGFGDEAYQIIGPSTAITDFQSQEWVLTWREWITHDQGFQLRLNQYFNPYYHRSGIEASWFHDF